MTIVVHGGAATAIHFISRYRVSLIFWYLNLWINTGMFLGIPKWGYPKCDNSIILDF